jgi:DNA-binding transcriptional ArsR family regulator
MLNYQHRDNDRLDRAFQALADPSRRGIVSYLSRSPASVSDIAGLFVMSMPAVMQHLQVLEKSELVKSAKKGRVRTYWVEPAALGLAQDWISEQRAIWEARLDRFENYLNELKQKEQDNG